MSCRPPETQVYGAASVAALKARSGQLTRMDVDELRELAEALLPPGHRLRGIVTGFATRWQGAEGSQAHIRHLGGVLLEDVTAWDAPAPRQRADVDG